jgi:hypothetical protein
MAIAYRLDQALRLTIVVWDGAVTAAEWRAHVEAILADADWPPGPLSVTDVTRVDASAITDADHAEIVAMYGPHASKLVGMRSAVIASREFEASARFGRRIESSGLNVIVFNQLTVACIWLGLDIFKIQPILEELRQD